MKIDNSPARGMRDLLPAGSTVPALPATFPRESPSDSGFVAPDDTSALHVTVWSSQAQAVAESAARSLSAPATCDPVKTGEEACVARILGSFGERTFRRPLDATSFANPSIGYWAKRRISGRTAAGQE